VIHVRFRKFLDNEDGATAIEYALIASMIALAIIGSLKMVRTSLNSNLNSVVTGFETAGQ
jgi:pilus assembly protein Flp/PilA